jgi:tRNA A37 threonylcarbamoyladenosine modification protein TsaB
VTLARTLAQQLDLPLDGISSFRLMARRLLGQAERPGGPFWLVQELPRRGLVAGLYTSDQNQPAEALEISAPRLYPDGAALADAEAILVIPGLPGEGLPLSVPRCPAQVQLPEDVAQLLQCSQAAAAAGASAPWSEVLPLYPTSPVGPPP